MDDIPRTQGGRQPGQRTPLGWRKDKPPRAYQLRDGRWQAKRRVKGQTITATKNNPEDAVFELRLKLRDLELGVSQPIKQRGKAETIDEWLWAYYERRTTGENAVEFSTAGQYKYNTDRMLDEVYGLTGTPLVDVTAQLLIAFRHKLETVPTKRTGKPLGHDKRKAIETRLNAALQAAVEEGKLPGNPFPRYADPGRRKKTTAKQLEVTADEKDRDEIKVRLDWYPQMIYRKLRSDADTSEEVEKSALAAVESADADYLDQAKKIAQKATQDADWAHTRLTMYLLSFYGLRPAEVRGLTLDKVRTGPIKPGLTVNQQLAHYNYNQNGKTGPYIKLMTKTVDGKRTIPLAEPLLSVVRHQVQRQRHGYDEHRKQLLDGNKLLLTAKRGGPIRQQVHDDDWQSLVSKELGLDLKKFPQIRLYANRHIANTIMKRADYPYDTRLLIMGWSPNGDHGKKDDRNNGEMDDIYNHWVNDQTMEAAKEIGRVILSEPTKPGYLTETVATINGEPQTQADIDKFVSEHEDIDVFDLIDDDGPPEDWLDDLVPANP